MVNSFYQSATMIPAVSSRIRPCIVHIRNKDSDHYSWILFGLESFGSSYIYKNKRVLVDTSR